MPDNTDNPLNFPDWNGIYQPRESYKNDSTASGSDNSGYARATMQDGKLTTETGKVQQASAADLSYEQNKAAGVPFDYAVDPITRCRVAPHELKEDSIVYFGECSMTLASARAANFIPANWKPFASAQPTPTNGAPNAPFSEGQEQQQEEVHPELAVDLLADIEVDKDYSALVETTGGAEQMQAIQQIVETGDMDAQTLGALASQLRCEPEQLQARAATIMKGFEDQARTVMSAGGLNSDDVVAYAHQNCPDKLKLAMNKQATMRQTSVYAEIRHDYLEGLDEHNPSAALNADLGPGITQFQDAKGRVMVRIPGMGDGITWKQAIKSFGVKQK